ncbi:hypothetical protein C4K23_5032 [Pseudomonas chlororaphis]|nr:hypothetical protein C4K23_5032 [Pseudomonas chlororaphis]
MRGRGSRHGGGLKVADSHESFRTADGYAVAGVANVPFFGAPRLSP